MPSNAPRLASVLPLLLLAGCLSSGGIGDGDPFVRGGAGGTGSAASSDRSSPAALDLTGVILGGAEAAPVPDALIHLEATSGSGSFRATSDSAGTFELGQVPVGTYTATASGTGFRTTETRLEVRGVPPVVIRVLLAADDADDQDAAITLSGGFDPLEASGFYTRRGRESGSFLDADEIRRRGSGRPSQLIVSLPGFRLTPQQLVVGRRGCSPSLFIDGQEVGDLRQIDGLVSLPLVAAIEAYPGSTPPAIFGGLNVLCGAVAIWNRRR